MVLVKIRLAMGLVKVIEKRLYHPRGLNELNCGNPGHRLITARWNLQAKGHSIL